MTLFSAEPMLCPINVDIPNKIEHHTSRNWQAHISRNHCISTEHIS